MKEKRNKTLVYKPAYFHCSIVCCRRIFNKTILLVIILALLLLLGSIAGGVGCVTPPVVGVVTFKYFVVFSLLFHYNLNIQVLIHSFI